MVDKFKKREIYLFNKAVQRAKELASITTEAPINMQISYRLACLQWDLAQEYRSEDAPYYVSRKRYEADLRRIDALAAEISEGAYKAQAVQAAAEAKEYLSLIAEYRIRNHKKNRVF